MVNDAENINKLCFSGASLKSSITGEYYWWTFTHLFSILPQTKCDQQL